MAIPRPKSKFPLFSGDESFFYLLGLLWTSMDHSDHILVPSNFPNSSQRVAHLGMRVGGIGIHGTKTLEFLGWGQFSPAFSSSLHAKNQFTVKNGGLSMV